MAETAVTRVKRAIETFKQWHYQWPGKLEDGTPDPDHTPGQYELHNPGESAELAITEIPLEILQPLIDQGDMRVLQVIEPAAPTASESPAQVVKRFAGKPAPATPPELDQPATPTPPATEAPAAEPPKGAEG